MTLLLPIAIVGAATIALLVVLVVQVLSLVKRPPATLDLSPLLARTEAIERAQERTERGLREELGRSREGSMRDSRDLRQETQAALDRLTAATEQKLEAVRGVIEERLKTIQQENAAKLDQIRSTVDEQLQTTLEKRLGESFKLVSDRLDQVHRGLGEMQTLAAGVGDLKKLLSNVRARYVGRGAAWHAARTDPHPGTV